MLQMASTWHRLVLTVRFRRSTNGGHTMAFHTELDLEEVDGLACSRRPWGLLTTTTVAYWGLLTTRATTTFNSCRKIHDLNNTQQTQKQLCYINHFPNSCRLIWRLQKSISIFKIIWENVKNRKMSFNKFLWGVRCWANAGGNSEKSLPGNNFLLLALKTYKLRLFSLSARRARGEDSSLRN